MPIYEYECEKCGTRFETLVSSLSKRIRCEKCKSVKVKKLISAFSAGAESCSSTAAT